MSIRKTGTTDDTTDTRQPERLAYRLDDLVGLIGVSRRVLERERSAGRLPKPDRVIGRMPVWTPATIKAWLSGS